MTPGQKLQGTREALGWSREFAAGEMHLSERYLRRMELDQHPVHPNLIAWLDAHYEHFAANPMPENWDDYRPRESTRSSPDIRG